MCEVLKEVLSLLTSYIKVNGSEIWVSHGDAYEDIAM